MSTDQSQRHAVHAQSGRSIDEIDVDAVVAGEIGPDDIRISPEGLARQAKAARDHGDTQLSENLLRAAELVALSEEQLLEYYEMLRPGRTDADGLRAAADDLANRGMPRVSALFKEAATRSRSAHDGDG